MKNDTIGQRRQAFLRVWIPLAAFLVCGNVFAQESAETNEAAEPAKSDVAAKVDKSGAKSGVVKGSSQKIEEIVVLGTGSVRSGQTLTTDFIETQAPMLDSFSLIDRLPGINVGQADAYGSDEWSTDLDIRGFDRDRLGFVIDGIPLGASNYRNGSRPNRFFDNENLQSISVIQGASAASAPSTQSLGGSVTYVTRGPEDEFGGQVSYTGGDDNMQRYFARIDTGPIMGGKTYAYFSYSDATYDHWMDYGARVGNSREHAEIALLHEFSPENSLQFKYVYNDRWGNNYDRRTTEEWKADPWNDGIHGAWTGNPRTDGYNSEGWFDPTEDEIISLEGKFFLPGDIDLKATAYNHTTKGPGAWPWECVFRPDDLYASDPGAYECDRDADGVASLMTMYLSYYPFERRGLNVNMNKEIGNHNLGFGVWYDAKDRNHYRTYNEVLDPSSGPAWGPAYWYEFDRQFNTDSISAYIQDSVSLLDDRLLVDFGVSATQVKIEYWDRLTVRCVGPCGQKNTYDSGTTWAPRLGARYDLTDNLELFGSYTRNFKMLQDYHLQERDVTNVDTETADSFDLGLVFSGNRVTATASVYVIDFDNQVIDFNFTIPPEDQGSRAYEADGVQINAGGTKSKGIEIAADFDLTDSLQFYISAAKNDSDSVTVVNVETDPFGDVSSIEWVDSKREDLSFFSEVTYRYKNFRIALNAMYEDEREGTISGSTPAPSYHLYGANASYNVDLPGSSMFDGLAFSLNVHNLMDEPYLSGVPRTGRFYIGAPRTTMLTVSTKF